VLEAVRHGRVFTVIDAIATPGALEFTAAAGSTTVPIGGTLPLDAGPATFRVRADVPESAMTFLLRNGEVVAQKNGGALDHASSDAGSYRVEIRTVRAPGSPPVPWLTSNPIFRFASVPGAAAAAVPEPASSPVDGPWRTEHSPGATATVAAGKLAIEFGYRLPDGPPASQFAALVRDLPAASDFSAIVFRARASRPMRISTQLRFAGEGGVRWRRSFYADASERDVRIPIDRMRPADGPGNRPPAARASSLLFVVDLTNAAPGAAGRFSVAEVRLVR
jgi:hypothetical protein